MDTPEPTPRADHRALLKPLVAIRLLITGGLMGLANLVPGVSGGTMVLVMGFYDEFINSIADATRFRFTKRNAIFLAILGGASALSIVFCAGLMRGLVTDQRATMYSLFVGLTVGGAPLLYGMMKPMDAKSIVLALAGLLMMIGIAATKSDAPPRTDRSAETEVGEIHIEAAYGLDLLAGLLGVSAMVLPGISGAYMLLVIGRYEAVLAAITAARQWVFSGGSDGDLAWLGVLIPVNIGMIVGVVTLSNLLKWLLRRHEKPTLGFLMGVLLGSVVGIWPFEGETTGSAYLAGGALAAVGFAITFGLSRRSVSGTT